MDTKVDNDLHIVGIKGLRILLSAVKSSWENGCPMILTAKEVIFESDGKNLDFDIADRPRPTTLRRSLEATQEIKLRYK